MPTRGSLKSATRRSSTTLDCGGSTPHHGSVLEHKEYVDCLGCAIEDGKYCMDTYMPWRYAMSTSSMRRCTRDWWDGYGVCE